jgi:hypothetical protein
VLKKGVGRVSESLRTWMRSTKSQSCFEWTCQSFSGVLDFPVKERDCVEKRCGTIE